MRIKDITDYLEQLAPLAYQESYDNCGLLVGNSMTDVSQILLTLDVTEAVIDEAIRTDSRLIIAHHPLIFKGLKSLTGKHWTERCVIKAIRNDIAIYAIHTNLDHVNIGVNRRIADRLGLQNPVILAPKKDTLSQLVTFVPSENVANVLNALYTAGAGAVGNYDHCSFQTEGQGSFRPGENTHPHIGQQYQDETVAERRIEVLLPTHLSGKVLQALRASHPYEEVAYYLTPLSNTHQETGSGMIGTLSEPMEAAQFLHFLKATMQTECIRHTALCKETIQKVAVCGGSGSFLLRQAIQAGADVLITGDFKYHEFFEADNQIIIADIGHYESEQFTKHLLYDILSKKFANIALRLTEEQTNPIKYL